MDNEIKNIKLRSSFEGENRPWHGDGGKRAVVLMSGGVDSSAAALILLKQGYEVAGLTMNISRRLGLSACKAASDVCRLLSIPHFFADIEDEFKRAVISPFCEAYRLGVTPNPCSDCNEKIKFGLLWDIAEREWGCDFEVATGHYARKISRNGRSYLARARNTKKDQSYFMSGIRPDRVGRLRLPLGDFESKDDTRRLVREAKLPCSERPESMDICFAAEDDYRSILDCCHTPGLIKDTEGNIIGRHEGIAGYTVGQRKGLGIAAAHPLYVTEIRPSENTVVAAPRHAAFRSEVAAVNANILAPDLTAEGLGFRGKVRSQQEPQPCVLLLNSSGRISVRFDKPVFAPAPGQRLVLYTEDGIVAAGGVIVRE